MFAPAVALVLALAVHSPSLPEALRRTVAVWRVEDQYNRDEAAFWKNVRLKNTAPTAAGEYPGYRELRRAAAVRLRRVVTADPADRAGREALLFAVGELQAGMDDPALMGLILKHHLAAPDLWRVIHHNGTDDTEFLKTIAEKSPDLSSRGRAFVRLTEWFTEHDRTSEALTTLARMRADAPLGTVDGFQGGTWHDTADRMRFEIERLAVGRPVPAFAGVDLDDKPMALADFKGKVTLIVFWATWCGPCLDAVPHEKALAAKYAGRPFAIVGVNGDEILALKRGQYLQDMDGRREDPTPVRKRVAALGMPWRSFVGGQSGGLAAAWNVRSWPTAYLVGHDGVIRGKWKGMPEDAELDAAVAKWVAAAEKK